MPPVGQLDVTSLSDDELGEMLREYGVDIGPINVATRRTYERYLIRLRTGQTSPPSQPYAPVDEDDDDEDYEVVLKRPSTSVQYQTPPPSQPRQRRDVPDSHIPTPRGDGLTSRGDGLARPNLMNERKATSTSYAPSQRSPRDDDEAVAVGGIPAWVKVTALMVVIVLVYLIYINMEPNAVSKIPQVKSKVEV